MLQKVIIVARHGPRHPVIKFSKLDQSHWQDLKTTNEEKMTTRAILTEKGKEFCKEFGHILKKTIL
jgi:hypothetical protein